MSLHVIYLDLHKNIEHSEVNQNDKGYCQSDEAAVRSAVCSFHVKVRFLIILKRFYLV